MEVLFQRCRSKKILSSFDKNMSFWQIPFGLKTSTSALVRGLERVLFGLSEFVISYVDDILVASENEKEYLTHLEMIFARFKERNITLNFRKCEFREGGHFPRP